ncbi:MAG: tectonin domain-containing protein, partial [Actinomycetota bacterium]
NTQGLAIKDNANDNYVADNVIANSLFDGIKHRHNYSSDNVFVGNRVGVGAAGGQAGNRYGVVLNGHDQLMLDNLIAYNRAGAVLVLDSRLALSSTTRYPPEKTVGNALRQNTFHNNGSGDGPAVRTQVDAWTIDRAAAVDPSDGVSRFTDGLWSNVSGTLRHVSVGSDGALWGINSGNSVYRRTANATSWQHMPDDLTLVQIDARDYNEAVAVDNNNQVYRFTNGTWTRIPGSLKHVSIGTDGSLWGIDSSEAIFRQATNGSTWQQVAGSLKQVDARTFDEAAGVNRNNQIYRFVNNRWVRLSGALKHVSIGTDGALWGTNTNNNVYRRTANANSWQQMQAPVSNDGTSIDLHPAGPTANDPGDRDDGPHLLLNTPELTGLGWVTNRGEIYGTACAGCTVEVSVSGSVRADGTIDASLGLGTGITWAGTVTARPDGTFSLHDTRFWPGKQLSLIAIDPTGNTSENLTVTMPSQAFGITGNPMASESRVVRPAPPARPPTWDPPTFSCELTGGTLTWDDAGAPEYYVFAVTNGTERYLGGHAALSLPVSAADS